MPAKGFCDPEKESHWRKIIECFEKSGLSGMSYCRREGIKYANFSDWRQRIGRLNAEGKKMAERTDKDWVEIIKKARKHPLGVKDYLEKQGINSKSYYKRFHRLRKTHPEWMPLSGRKGIRRGQKKSNANDPSTTFVPLQLTNKANLDSKTLSSDPSSIVEIVLSNDVVLRVNSNCSPDFAVRLAHAFGAR